MPMSKKEYLERMAKMKEIRDKASKIRNEESKDLHIPKGMTKKQFKFLEQMKNMQRLRRLGSELRSNPSSKKKDTETNPSQHNSRFSVKYW